jgi:hypothetical protein
MVGGSEGLQPVLNLAPSKVSKLDIVEERELGVSSTESIRTTRARLVEEGRDLGWYVIKQFRGQDRVDEHLAAYDYLNKAGFPVPAEARRIAGRPDSMAVTDLTENGRLEIYSYNTPSDSGFVTRPGIANIDEVRQEFINIAQRADKLGLIITNDSYFFVYDPVNMEGHVVIGDLGGAVMTREVAQREYGYGSDDTTTSLIRDSFFPGLVARFNGGQYFPDARLEIDTRGSSDTKDQ